MCESGAWNLDGRSSLQSKRCFPNKASTGLGRGHNKLKICEYPLAQATTKQTQAETELCNNALGYAIVFQRRQSRSDTSQSSCRFVACKQLACPLPPTGHKNKRQQAHHAAASKKSWPLGQNRHVIVANKIALALVHQGEHHVVSPRIRATLSRFNFSFMRRMSTSLDSPCFNRTSTVKKPVASVRFPFGGVHLVALHCAT